MLFSMRQRSLVLFVSMMCLLMFGGVSHADPMIFESIAFEEDILEAGQIYQASTSLKIVFGEPAPTTDAGVHFEFDAGQLTVVAENLVGMIVVDSLDSGSLAGLDFSGSSNMANIGLNQFVVLKTATQGLIVLRNIVKTGSGVTFDYEKVAAGSSVPEPGTLILLGLGVVGLFGFMRKRRGNGRNIAMLLCLALSVALAATAQAATFMTSYEDYENSSYADEEGRVVQPTADGGYIIIGNTNRQGGGDIFVNKLNAAGTIVWQRTYGTASDDYAYAGQQTTPDGGYIVAGYTEIAGNRDAWVFKLDSDGNVLWERRYGGTNAEEARSIQQAKDGNFIVAGFTESSGAGSRDVWALKLNATTGNEGNVLWQKTYGGAEEEGANAVYQTLDLGYILAGWINRSSTGLNVYLLKIDANGNRQWDVSYGAGSTEIAYAVQQTSDKGYIVAGYTTANSATRGEDALVIKFGASTTAPPAITWQKAITTYSTSGDRAYAIQQTKDLAYLVVGQGRGSSGWLLKLASTGASALWSNMFDNGNPNIIYSAKQTPDGGYVALETSAGNYYTSTQDVFLVKTDASGTIPGCNYTWLSSSTVSALTLPLTKMVADIASGNSAISPETTSLTPIETLVQKRFQCSGLDCGNALELTKNGTFTGTTPTASGVDYYGATYLPGGEKVYKFYSAADGKVGMTFTSTLPAGTLKAQIFEGGCYNPDTPVATINSALSSTTNSSGTKTFQISNGNSYYIVIDGAKSGGYTLKVDYPIGYENWSLWVDSTQKTASDVTMASVGNVLYQSIKDAAGYVYTRFTEDGYSWDIWQGGPTVAPLPLQPKSAGKVTMQELNGDLYQAIRETTTNNILTRQFSLASGTLTMGPWKTGMTEAKANRDITMASYNGQLYQATTSVGTTMPVAPLNTVLTRSCDESLSCTSWQPDPQAATYKALSNVAMTPFFVTEDPDYTPSSGDEFSISRLYQATTASVKIAGVAYTKVITRWSDDGINWYHDVYSNPPEAGWDYDSSPYMWNKYSVIGNVSMITYEDSWGSAVIVQAVRKSGTNTVLTRRGYWYSYEESPGVYIAGIDWGVWQESKKVTTVDIAMYVFKGKLYQAINSVGKVWTRYTTNPWDDGAWTDWVADGATTGAIAMADVEVFNTRTWNWEERLYQATKASTLGTVWTRYTNANEVVMAPPVPQTVIIRKSGSGNGMITVGSQSCDALCSELTVPYVAGQSVNVNVVPAADSVFIGWQKADGTSISGVAYAQPGETVLAVFEKK